MTSNTTVPDHVGQNADYVLYLFDMLGTTTPTSHVQEMIDYAKQPDVMQKLLESTNYSSVEEISDLIKQGHEKGKNRDKDNDIFRGYIKLLDVATKIGYESGALPMPLEDGVEEAFEAISNAESRIRIYSSGALDSLEAGYKTTPLDQYIEKYHSSADQPWTSKTAPDSYKAIAEDAGVDISKIAFITDAENEALAAVEAGCGKTYLYDKKAQHFGETDKGYIVIDTMKYLVDDSIRPNYAGQPNPDAAGSGMH